MSFVTAIVDFISGHPGLAYAVVFVLTFFEAVPFVGVVIPGQGITMAISAFVPSGAVDLGPLLAASTGGAVIGDGVSFWVGRRYKAHILERWPLNRSPQVIARSRAFFDRHGGKSVFLARFVPWLRAFVPLMAGILDMPVRRFYLGNVLSALVWGPIQVLPGLIIGASLGMFGWAAGRLIVLLTLVALIVWVVVKLMRVLIIWGVPHVRTALERVRVWAWTRDGWLPRQITALLDPAEREAKVLVMLAALLCAIAAALSRLDDTLLTGDLMIGADSAIYQWLQAIRTPAVDAVMRAVGAWGTPAVLIPLSLSVTLWMAWSRAWRPLAYWAAAIWVAATLGAALGAGLPRPSLAAQAYAPGLDAFSLSSVSGTISVTVYAFLAFLAARRLRPAWQVPVAIAVVILLGSLAFSQLYLGLDWFSNVAGRLAFGLAWVGVLSIAYLYHQPAREEPQGLLAVTCAALIVIGGSDAYRLYRTDGAGGGAAAAGGVSIIAAPSWWETEWQSLPAFRADLNGDPEEPLTFQWAGEITDLERRLVAAGWQPPRRWTLASSLAWLTETTDPMSLPVLPYLDEERTASLILVRPTGGAAPSRLVLRVWEAGADVRDGETAPLWLGSVIREEVRHPLNQITIIERQRDADGPRAVLASALAIGRLAERPSSDATAGWDGRVLLAHTPAIRVDISPFGSAED